jgi:preprotein translocase subunit Sec63
VTSERFASQFDPASTAPGSEPIGNSARTPVDPIGYYALLGLPTTASAADIRQAYRTLSRQYHPDTTLLPGPAATLKFQQLNEAYATLSNPDRRAAYDQPMPNTPSIKPRTEVVLPFDAADRPLSAGELFALMILGLTFVACLILALTLGWAQGQAWWQDQPAPIVQADRSDRVAPPPSIPRSPLAP